MASAIVVDLDGTLFDVNHRVHLAQAGLWDEFNALCMDDEIIEPIQELVFGMDSHGFDIIVLTGRSEKYRTATERKLLVHEIPAKVVLMRPENDFQPDSLLKIDLLEKYFVGKENVLSQIAFVLDDRDKVVQALRDYGLVVLQCREGDY